MVSSDITIIGGGPCGSFAAISALFLNKRNEVTIIEKRKRSGYPPHCSGLIGIEGLKTLKIYKTVLNKMSLNRINCAKFVSPSGKSIKIQRRKDELLVLDRPQLDAYLAAQAKKLGAKLLYQHKVRDIKRRNEAWQVFIAEGKNSHPPFSSKIVISAEGHHPIISAQVGLSIPSTRWFLPALQYEMDNVLISEKETVELYFGNKVAPGFFAWMIPLNDKQARVGLAIHPNLSKGVRKSLNYIIKKHPTLSPKLKKSSILSSWGGFVPTSGPINKTFSNGFMVVGDAAGQTKATTGGGFNIGGFCGQIAGMVASQSIRQNDYSSKFLNRYESIWKSKYEPELSLMKFLRRLVSFLPDKTLDSLFEIAIHTELARKMKNVNNIDLHGIGLLKYSFNPNVFVRGLRHTPHVVNSLFHGLLD